MINNIHLMGRLVADPELKSTKSGTEFCSYTLAVEDDIKDKDGNKAVDFIECVTYGKPASMVNRYFQKGQMMAVIGKLKVKNYKDKSGNYRTSVGVVTEHISFCGDYAKKAEAPKTQAKSDFDTIDDEEGLPF